mmetsp:Transcript_25036/g.22207  ORF Transcript_25036/g.22207 Transcript_25036/m.22207 type:complete len:105 (+) Transcript_25036:52-366(+)
MPVNSNSQLGNVMDDIRQKAGRKLTKDDKVQIVNTLMGINGSMKEFSQDLQFRLNRAYKDQAGKKFGLSKAQKQTYAKKRGFATGNYDAVATDAKRFLKKFQKA